MADEVGVGGGPLLKGEVHVFRDVECYLRGPTGQRVPGSLTATTYLLRFTPGSALPASMRHNPLSSFAVPVASIRKIERPSAQRGAALGIPGVGSGGGPSALLDITCKDVRAMGLGFRDEATADKMATHLRMVVFPSKIEFVHAFAEGAKLAATAAAGGAVKGASLPGWDVYSPLGEFERQGVLRSRHPRSGEALYRVCEINSMHTYAPTYPALLIMPSRSTDAQLVQISTFRSKARIPALTWMHPGNKTTMWRCSQPRVGMSGNTCAADEALVAMLKDGNVFSRDPHQPLLIADCRPRANAMANKAGGWGYEVYPGTSLEFLNMHNIHAVRDSHRAVEALCLGLSPNDVNWTAAVSETSWLYHLRTVLSAGLFVAEAMHRRGAAVLVHCSDGWDRTAQVCGLVQLMLDPYFRTMRGFAVLVAKDWASFGHKFGERAGHREEKDGGDISPVFLQFLDAVHQLQRLFPAAFEFDGRMLLYVAHHVYSCRFGTFLPNNERETVEGGLKGRTGSIWGHLLAHSDAFRSPSYAPGAGDVLLPHPAAILRNVVLWREWFLRYSPFPSASAECRMERYAEGVYDRAPLHAAMVAVPAVEGPSEDTSTATGGREGAARPSVRAPASAGGSSESAGAGVSPLASSPAEEVEAEAEFTTSYLARDEGDAEEGGGGD